MNTRVMCAVMASAVAGLGLAQALANPGFTGSYYGEATSDIGSGLANGGGTLDLVGMEVSNTATDIVFKLTVNGSFSNVDWGKFMVGIATNNGSGTSTGNGWGRPINMSANGGMTHWIGSWVDGGGGSQLWTHGSGSWSGPASTGFSFSGSDITWTVSMAALGLNVGDSFTFDAYSSGGGGGDGAIDALSSSSPSVANWGDTFTTTSGFSYTIVPAPGALALLAVAGLGRRARK